MSTENKMRFGFLLFWTLMLGIDVATGRMVWALIAMLFIGLNLFRLYTAYEDGEL